MEPEIFTDAEMNLLDMWETESFIRERAKRDGIITNEANLGVAEILKSLRRIERHLQKEIIS